MDDGAILELDGDRLIVELHQKSTYAMRVSIRPEHFGRRTYTGKVPQITDKPCLEVGIRTLRASYWTIRRGGDDEDEDERDVDARPATRCQAPGDKNGSGD